MKTIEATFRNGQIIPDEMADWPEGCRLRIEPVATERAGEMTGDDAAETPEQIDDWLRWYHSLEPLEFTPEEEAALADWRQKVREYEQARAQERTEGLFP